MGICVIFEDTLNQDDKHATKHGWWEAHGVEVVRTRFDGKHGVPWSFGDYCRDGSNIVVDTKAHIDELASNLGRDHDRFRREIARANEAGCLLVVLVETDEATCLEDVREWTNGHCRHCNRLYSKACVPTEKGTCMRHGTKKPLQGPTLYEQMHTMEMTRCVRFEFVEPERSAERICELLGVKYEEAE